MAYPLVTIAGLIIFAGVSMSAPQSLGGAPGLPASDISTPSTTAITNQVNSSSQQQNLQTQSQPGSVSTPLVSVNQSITPTLTTTNVPGNLANPGSSIATETSATVPAVQVQNPTSPPTTSSAPATNGSVEKAVPVNNNVPPTLAQPQPSVSASPVTLEATTPSLFGRDNQVSVGETQVTDADAGAGNGTVSDGSTPTNQVQGRTLITTETSITDNDTNTLLNDTETTDTPEKRMTTPDVFDKNEVTKRKLGNDLDDKRFDIQTQIYILSGTFGGILFLLIILVLGLALAVAKLKNQLKNRQDKYGVTSSTSDSPDHGGRQTKALRSPDGNNHHTSSINAYVNSAFNGSSHEMEERRSEPRADLGRMGFEVFPGNRQNSQQENNSRASNQIPRARSKDDRVYTTHTLSIEDGVAPRSTSPDPKGDYRRSEGRRSRY